MKIPATHPVVRAMAEELAAEHRSALVSASIALEGGVSFSITMPRPLVEAQVSMLVDLTRPASRDAWVRWLAANQTDLGDYALNLRRDNPEALAAAVCAALETM